MFRKLSTCLLYSGFFIVAKVHGQPSTADSIRWSQQLLAIEQRMMDAIPTGDTAVWSPYLHPAFFVVTEDGSRMQRQEFLAGFRPLPKGYNGYIKVTQPKVVFHGGMAVVNYVSDEYENVFQSRLHTQYNSMNTYLKADTAWQLVSSQVFEIPLLPPVIKLPPALLREYAGTYALSDTVTVQISVEKDSLFYQRKGRPKTALLAETSNVFFRSTDARGRKLFVKNDKGTMLMLERRNGQDVVWQRVKKGGS